MKGYLQLWGYCLIDVALGCFVLFYVIGSTEQANTPLMYGCAGAMFSVAFYALLYAVFPIWKYVSGRIKGQPYSFKERLTGVR